MRANIPISDEFNPLQPVGDSKSELTPEQIALAKIGVSDGWKLLKEYMSQRIETYKVGLFGEDLAGKDTAIIGQRFLASQAVIKEFTGLIDEIDRTTQTVKEVRSGGVQKQN